MASISVSLDRNADRHDVKLLKRELDTLPGVTSAVSYTHLTLPTTERV